MTLDELKQKARECADGGWVKLPEPPPLTLPSETVLRYPHGVLWCAQEELVLVGSCEYRGELRRGKQTVAGATFQTLQVKLPPGYRFEGSEVVKEEELRQLVCRKVECVRCSGFQSYNLSYRSADAQRFYCSKGCHDLAETKPVGVDPAVPGSDITGIQVVADKSVPKEWVYISTPPKSGKSALLSALQEQSMQLAAMYQQEGGLGLSDYVFRQGDYEPKLPAPACACGAVSNLRAVSLTGYRCGSCEQSRRRAELQAQKLEQTKRDMNRPVKRDPYEWLGFSSSSWEE